MHFPEYVFLNIKKPGIVHQSRSTTTYSAGIVRASFSGDFGNLVNQSSKKITLKIIVLLFRIFFSIRTRIQINEKELFSD